MTEIYFIVIVLRMSQINGKNTYTATEVGTLIESFQSKLGMIAEEVQGFSKWRLKTDSRLERIETRLTCVEDVIRIAIPAHEKRLKKLESKVGIKS